MKRRPKIHTKAINSRTYLKYIHKQLSLIADRITQLEVTKFQDMTGRDMFSTQVNNKIDLANYRLDKIEEHLKIKGEPPNVDTEKT